MKESLNVLIVEDSEDDAMVLIMQLNQDGYQTACERVDTAGKLQAALEKPKWDVIISNYMLSGLSGLEALQIIHDRRVDIPCLIVSDKVTPETAVSAMRAGAKDYITKDNLGRLGPAVDRELKEAAVRKERCQAEERLKGTNNLDLERKLRKELELFNHRIIQAHEEERKRIVSNLHDDTAQVLVIIKLELGAIIRSDGIKSKEDLDRLEHLKAVADQAIQDVRRFSNALLPGELDFLGLDTALGKLALENNTQDEFTVEYQVTGESRRLASDVELVLFRIAQEAVSNIQKHSFATRAVIRMEYFPERIRMVIEDNGQGFNIEKECATAVSNGRLGLIGMRERAHLINARLTIESRVGNGTTVAIEFKTMA